MDSRDLSRKAVHAGMGLLALLLRWIDWKTAAALAAAALLFNLFVMPRIGRGIYRDPSKPRDPGIVAYPTMVLVLILLFRRELAAAAALWGMMAFGDPAASIVGKAVGGPRLPWNAKKTWSGLVAYWAVGGGAALSLWGWVSARDGGASIQERIVPLLLVAALAGALLESIDAGIDDNWLPAIPCAALLAFELHGMAHWRDVRLPEWGPAFWVNLVVALIMLGLKVVSPSGALAGGVLGFVILAFAGWPAYAVLWGFFLLATLSTKWGYRRKHKKGTAQSSQGRRGARHAIANCGVGAVLAAASTFSLSEGMRLALLIAFSGAFAAALADTLGTELGSLYGRRPFSILERRRVPPGTSGAVSVAGIAGGLAGALAIAAIAVVSGLIPFWEIGPVAVGGLVGSLAESLMLDTARRRGHRIDHDFANALNTFVGAAVALEYAVFLGLARVYLPFELGS